MYKIQHIEKHLEKVYGFETVPCSIPRNSFQYLKRNVYLWIYNKVSQKLFFFLRDKVSPIKYLNERPEKEIWFRYRGDSGRVEFEIEVKPIQPDISIYTTDIKGIFKPDINGDNYKVKIYPDLSDCEHRTFPMNSKTGIKSMNAHLSDFPVLKQKLRENKLSNILK